MTRATRKTCRERLGSDLSTAMTGAGNPAQVVYDYLKTDFTESPVVCIASASQMGEPLTFQGAKGLYAFLVIVFVARGEDLEEIAEDALDNCAEKIFAYVTSPTNRVIAGIWNNMVFLRESDIDEIPSLGGDPHWMETHYVGVESY